MSTIAPVVHAVYDALKGDTNVTNKLGTSWIVTLYGTDAEAPGIFPEGAPPGEEMPYIVFGDCEEKPNYNFGGKPVFDVTLKLYVWSNTPDLFKCLDILGEVERVLDGSITLDSAHAIIDKKLGTRGAKRHSSLVWYVEMDFDLTIEKVN